MTGLGGRGLGVERVDDDPLRRQLAHAVAVEPALEHAVVGRDLAAAAQRLRGRGPLRLAGAVDGRAERLRPYASLSACLSPSLMLGSLSTRSK